MADFTELDLLHSPFVPGLTVIEASAGTGKTYSISHLVPRLLLEGALPDLSKLLLVTFTKDAARELSDRVRRVLTRLATPPTPDEADSAPHIAALRVLLNANTDAQLRLQRALNDLDLLAVSTIHAFCQRTLQQEGSLCGLPVLPEVITDDSAQLLPLLREQWIASLSADPLLASLAIARNWQLNDVLALVAKLRGSLSPRSEPAPENFASLRAQIDASLATLQSADEQARLLAHLAPVDRWNKKQTTASIHAKLHAFFASRPTELTFWNGLGDIAVLDTYIPNSGKINKPVRAGLADVPWFVAAQSLFALADQLQWSWHHQLAHEVVARLDLVLARHRLITQDGLIGALHHALHREGPDGETQSARLAARLAERYHIALIDESQDTDPRQFAIFERIFLAPAHRRRLILVGDPKQAIYGFRGADLSTYLSARNRADASYKLTHTHRAPPPLVETVNQLFSRKRAFHHADMRFFPATSALKSERRLLRRGQPCPRLEAWIVAADDDPDHCAKARCRESVSDRVASTIVDLLHHGQLATVHPADALPPEPPVAVTPRDIAVLVSDHFQASAMADALEQRGVPVVLNSGADVFSSEEADNLRVLLLALLDPRRTKRLRSALATRLFGFDANALAALDTEESAPPAPSAPNAPPTVPWRERFAHWNQVWTRRGFASLLAELDHPDIGVSHRLATIPLTGERRVTNYRHLTDLLLEASREIAPQPAELVRWLGQQIASAEARSQAEERQLQLSSDRPAVQVVTMHKAKGLEYPLVFCPYLFDPLREPADIFKLPASHAATDDAQDLIINRPLLNDDTRTSRTESFMAAQLEERLRLTYVALTRAQVAVWIYSCSPHPKSDRGSALDWLLHSNEDLDSPESYTAAWVERVKAGRSARHTAALTRLGGRPHDESVGQLAASLITFRPPPDPTRERYVAASAVEPEAAAAPLAALPVPKVPPSWRVTSFSTLTREKHAHGSASAAPSAAAPDEPVDPLLAELASAVAASTTAAPTFLEAPAGAAIGTAVHDWIETWDFSPPDTAALSRHIAAARLPAPRAGLPSWRDILGELFATLRTIRLPGCDASPLHEICPDAHGSEWHFHLPIRDGLTVAALARCFAEHAAPEHRSYAPQLAALSDENFHGLLQGFIDRLARHENGWGVIDWKTNRLGPALSDYDEPALLRCAMDAHYLLQTHLYLVALRRYLRALGLADTPLAGAWLVFLRAIAPDSTRGVLHVNPPPAMIDALDALFAEPSTVLAHADS